MKKRIIAGLMAAIMLMGMTSAMAADETVNITTDGGSGTTTVTLTAEAATFSVDVPTGIPIKVNSDGTVTVPSNLAITSASSAPVKVTKVEMTNGTWNLVGYDAANMAAEKVGSKKLAFSITAGADGVDKATLKTADMAEGVTSQELGTPNWTIAAKTGSLPIELAAKASTVSEAITAAENAATVVFTIGWAE